MNTEIFNKLSETLPEETSQFMCRVLERFPEKKWFKCSNSDSVSKTVLSYLVNSGIVQEKTKSNNRTCEKRRFRYTDKIYFY